MHNFIKCLEMIHINMKFLTPMYARVMLNYVIKTLLLQNHGHYNKNSKRI